MLALLQPDGDDLVFEDRHRTLAVDSGSDHRTQRHQQGPGRPEPPPPALHLHREEAEDAGVLAFLSKQLHRYKSSPEP